MSAPRVGPPEDFAPEPSPRADVRNGRADLDSILLSSSCSVVMRGVCDGCWFARVEATDGGTACGAVLGTTGVVRVCRGVLGAPPSASLES